MKVYDELSWYDILTTSWSGAKDTAQTIEEHDKGEEFCALIEELYGDEIDRTQLNDILWFEDEWLFEQLGIKDEEEQDEEEDKEEDKDEENEEEAEDGNND